MNELFDSLLLFREIGIACLELHKHNSTVFKTDPINRIADEAEVARIVGIVFHVGKQLLEGHAVLDDGAAVIVHQCLVLVAEEGEFFLGGEIEQQHDQEEQHQSYDYDELEHLMGNVFKFKSVCIWHGGYQHRTGV